MSTGLRPGDGGSWLPPGTRLNDLYEIEEGIASGGMGEIYRGRAIETGDLVAIKTIRSDVADSDAALGMFRREASALHNLYHEAIVRYYVFSVDRTLNRPYLAMEFVSGPSLSDMLKNGPLDYDSVRVLGARVASGLQAAHERGIVHRDMSPDNVIIPDGDVARAKIIDFGIARQTKQSEGTIIGDGFAGKYNYVSPEQLGMHGGDVTGASDIYSLGLVLAEAIAGRALNMRGNPVEVIEKRRGVPDISHLDPRLRLLVARMLQSEPQNRPGSMREVASWLRRGHGQTQPPVEDDHEDEHEGTVVSLSPRPRPTAPPGAGTGWGMSQPPTQAPADVGRSRFPLIAAGVAVVLLTSGGGAYFLLSGGPSPAPKVETAERPPAAAPPQREEAPRPTPAPETRVTRVERPEPKPEASATEIAAFLDRQAAGACVFFAPVVVGDGRLVADGFARSAAELARVSSAADGVLGFAPDLTLREVTSAQCPVVDMLAGSRAAASSLPRLEIASQSVKPGDLMMGEAAGPDGAFVGVARVGADGMVTVLAPAARTATGVVPFETAVDPRADAPDLVVAFSADQPVSGLDEGARLNAGEFVDRLNAVSQSGVAGVARYVVVAR